MILNLPSITHALNDFFLMKLEDKSSSQAIDCDIVELSFSKGFGVPQQPIDSNTFIGDTIWSNPFSCSLRVWVYEQGKEKFENQILDANNKNGFKIIGINGVYDNLRITHFNFSESTEVQGGYFYNIDFVEVVVVTAGIIALAVPKIKNPADSSPVDKGSKNPKDNRTTAKIGLDKVKSMIGIK